MKYFYLFLLLLIPSLLTCSPEQAEQKNGTLIVTFHTDRNAERLDRVRFWLVNERGDRRLYPSGKAYVDDNDHKVRMVLIENLAKGDYEIEFLIPNKDGYFDEVPAKTISISSGGVVKIDQWIKPTHPEVPPSTNIAMNEEIEEISPRINTPLKKTKLPRVNSYEETIAINSNESTSISVSSNNPDAIYLLRSRDNNKSWKGEGREFTFHNLPYGTYSLSFASSNPQESNAPEEKIITLPSSALEKNATIFAQYEMAGKLEIGSNIPRYQAKITSLTKGGRPHRETIRNYKKTLYLPPGYYIVTFIPGRESNAVQLPKPQEVEIKPNALATAFGEFSEEELYGSAPPPAPPRIPHDPTQAMATIDGGFAIFGDPFNDNKSNELPGRKVYIDAFELSLYEITNKQFAKWLTDAVNKGFLLYKENGKSSGLVVDREGHLICKTNNSEAKSQIFATKLSNKSIDFQPLPGKDEHPAIFVTWYGAVEFCKAHRGRLPTEAEWEKAAAMAPPRATQPLRKYRYGFGRDTIDRRWANYKWNDQRRDDSQVNTTPVGFYDGKNLLNLEIDDNRQMMTNNAKSPSGLYDMSGNVWEWTNDWFADKNKILIEDNNPEGPSIGVKKVVKGGCYDSLEEGVRVAERMGLLPEYCDEFTGFRFARDAQE